VLAENDSADLLLLPVGPDVPRNLAVGDLMVTRARFLHGDNDIVFMGRHPQDKQFHLYKMSLNGGPPVAISDFGVWGYDALQVSSDDRLITTLNPEEILTVYPADGGSPLPLDELGEFAEAVAWSPEGHLWVRPRKFRELPSRILLYDITARRVMQERPFSLNDATGVSAVFRAFGTPDGRAIAFDYPRELGHLYLLDGLAPALR
jgi:hypothetical protein